MSEWVDDLARTVARDGMTRRRVLRIALGAAIGSVLPFRLTRAALADAPADCPGTRTAWSSTCASPVTKLGYVDSYNGCGPANGLLTYVLPDFPLGANFRAGCNNHDLCYGTCGSDKDICDTQFHSQLTHACATKFGGGGLVDGLQLGICNTLADDYWSAVVLGGGGAFQSAQQDACDCCACPNGCGPCEYCSTSSDPAGTCLSYCTSSQTCCGGALCVDPCVDGGPPDPVSCQCPQRVYCACNQLCWTDASSCLAHCHASLTCFSGICGPAEPGQCAPT
jgi:hypothetical protein